MPQLLNLGCGGNRPGSPWINVDALYEVFPDETCPERVNLGREPNYVNADLREKLPFDDCSVEGMLASHLLEHMDCHQALKTVTECYRVLVPEGVIRISTPDPVKFLERQVLEDAEQDAEWGEKNPHYPEMTFTKWALFFHEHKQLLTVGAVNILLYMAGFRIFQEQPFRKTWLNGLSDLDNRRSFSTFIEGKK